ncbi:MAG: sensor histidine kinase [Anaerolineales bacterium]
MTSIASRIREKLKEQQELWFFIFANIVFLAMYVWSFNTNPTLFSPVMFLVFTMLMITHIALHWMLLLISDQEKWFWPYVITQGLLAFTITALSQNIGMIFALFMALIGEIIGYGQRISMRLTAVVFFVFLSLINFILMNGIEYSGWWLLGTVPMLIFVTMYVSLYTSASNDRDQARKFLVELEIANRQLAEYTNQVEELTLTTERQRMARELHDTLAQGLAGLILQLEAADSHISSQNPQKAQAIIQQAMSRARATLSDARRAIRDLRENPSTPTDLDDAIKTEIERFHNSTGIPCKANICMVSDISAKLAENILRAISEGLSNIARHAEATEACILMTCDNQIILVEISDNGIGFDPEKAIGQSGHYGLVGIRERARLYGGSLTIDSQPSQGSIIKILLPLVNSKINQ